MARKAFYSFHYKEDNWRVSQVRNIGVVDGSRVVSDNDWETVKGGGDLAIQRWIDGQLYGKSVVIVLIGSKTASRKWIKYEIQKAWNDRKGLLGIHIHNLKDKDGNQSVKGKNPFETFTVNGVCMSEIVQTYNPGRMFTSPYDCIKEDLAAWVETAIRIRANHG